MNAPEHPLLRERAQLYADMQPLHLRPLWQVLHQLVPPFPQTPCVPALWKYDQVRPFLMRAGDLISAEEAVRRVLILENPALPGQAAITQSLYAGLQLILPGEVAPAHRHTQSALRFIVEGAGAFTAVDGERVTMQPGDFIITPSWTWHDHGHPVVDGGEPVVWLDGLDIPMLRFFDAGFAESAPAAQQALQRAEGSNAARYAHNLAPLRPLSSPFGATSPIFSYPYARSREALAQLAARSAPDACEGWKLRYVNPLSGAAPMPTIATFLQLLPPMFIGDRARSTDGTVVSVVEGRARLRLWKPSPYGTLAALPATPDAIFEVGPRDHVVVPSWHAYAVDTLGNDAVVLFSFSDRPVQQALAIWREERPAGL